MNIGFRTRRIGWAFNSETDLCRGFCPRIASAIMTRLVTLESADHLAEMSTGHPARTQSLSGDRKGQFAVDLVGPHRLVFESSHIPPLKADGGIDLERVVSIRILEVVDYH